jgi:hypothetical protein
VALNFNSIVFNFNLVLLFLPEFSFSFVLRIPAELFFLYVVLGCDFALKTIGLTQVIFICTKDIMMPCQQFPVCLLLLWWDLDFGIG